MENGNLAKGRRSGRFTMETSPAHCGILPFLETPDDAKTTAPHISDPLCPRGARMFLCGGLPSGANLSDMKPGIVYKDHGVEKPGLEIFRDNGYNWVRYRLWHTPTRGA